MECPLPCIFKRDSTIALKFYQGYNSLSYQVASKEKLWVVMQRQTPEDLCVNVSTR